MASTIAVVLALVLYCEPRYGQTNIMIYIGVCSVIGSLTVSTCHCFCLLHVNHVLLNLVWGLIKSAVPLQVMSVKALGIAIKLTLEGSSQVAHFKSCVFAMVAATCVITQLNYLNKVGMFRPSNSKILIHAQGYKFCDLVT